MAKKVKKAIQSSEAKRKRRTREHVLESLSIHHLEGLIIRCGYTMQRNHADYGYDVWLQTYQDNGEIENDYVQLQLKASESLQRFELVSENFFSFPVTTKDFHLWRMALLPVFLVVYDAAYSEAYWLHVQEYARTLGKVTGKYVRMKIPRNNIVGVQTIQMMRQRKNEVAAKMGAGMEI